MPSTLRFVLFSLRQGSRRDGRIERFFRTVNEMFLCELDGYARRKRQRPSLSLQQFEDRFRTFLLEIYHRRTSVEGRLPPSERWEDGGFLPRMPESLEQLDLLLMQEVRPRKVRRDGIHSNREASRSLLDSMKSSCPSTRATWAIRDWQQTCTRWV